MDSISQKLEAIVTKEIGQRLTYRYQELFLGMPPFPDGYTWAIREIGKTGAWYLDLSNGDGLVASSFIHPDERGGLAARFILACAVNDCDLPSFIVFSRPESFY